MNPKLETRNSKLVVLVGAGPGDPKLLTLRGQEVLMRADVVLYDALVNPQILMWARRDAEKIFVGKRAGQHALTQDEINALIVEKANENKIVCRLKGGDPFVFGRGGEEVLACVENEIPFEIVPGISSAIAAPAYAGIPVTHRADENFGGATSFAVVTGHTKNDDAPPENLPRADTLVFLMGVRALPKIVQSLVAQGREPSTPVALVRWGTTQNQQVVVGTLETIEAEVEKSKLQPPALIVVGEVVRLREKMAWFDNPKFKPLWGQTVVVTRAREQASSLVEELRNLGAQVLQCPTIRVEDLDEYSLCDNAIATLHNFDWIVFTSTNGVEKFWNRLHAKGKDARWLANAKVAAIGPATHCALQSRGIEPDFVPQSSISEDVAAGLRDRGSDWCKILIVRAQEGREVLETELYCKGAFVEVVPVYRTVPDAVNAELIKEKLQAGEIDWITFTSSSTVTNFVAAVGSEVLAAHRDSFRVACIGPVTEQTARENGLVPDVVAQAASVESLAEAMVEFVKN